ncbi:hypothetical protein [Burkholderia sp. Ax-1719]|uniref:hypothetical protein n=1 Tax=Burkholderia sp. Ax-1719 TaxID=2608334 RepID=UPI0014228092|nr:hypothetical protein [Burkholderia sp. Ax-1719]NIE67439.1 hypothetical protein [Burkholderia sp. Ax-1719]
MDDAIQYCRSLREIWGDDIEEIEAHMESQGFTDHETACAIERVCPEIQCFDFELVIVGPA